MFKDLGKGFNNLSNAVQGIVRGTVVGNAVTGGDGNIFGGGGESTQTTTQQNLPDWAIPAAMGTLSMGDYYTMNPNYRPSTLDRDYSGIRGYNAEGQPNSQVGQFGLNPMPAVPPPPQERTPEGGIPPGVNPFVDLDLGGVGRVLPGGSWHKSVMNQMTEQNPVGPTNPTQRYQTQGPVRPRTGLLFEDEPHPADMVANRGSGSAPGLGIADRVGSEIIDDAQRRQQLMNLKNGNLQSPQPLSPQGPVRTPAGRTNTGRTATRLDDPSQPADSYSEIGGSPGSPPSNETQGSGLTSGDGASLTENDEGAGTRPTPVMPGTYNNNDSSSSNTNTNINTNTSDSSSNTNPNNPPPGMTAEEVQAQIDQALQQFDENTITPDEMPTPFQAYDRQRFAAPGANTVAGESILAGRYGQRFGEGGTDPFADANAAVEKAAGFSSDYSGTMGTTTNLGGTSGGYRDFIGSPTTKDPGIFKAGDYTTDLTQYSNPNADLTNVNAGMANVNAGMQNVNAGMTAAQYGNANQGLQGPINYQQQRSLRDSMQQFQDPYTDQVVNQTIRDMDRARKMTANQISGDSAKAGAYGGSRSMLMQAENNRNFADRTAAAVGQLRSQGFQRAADLAQQENLQRLGLSASDVQQARGLQSQGNLQGQTLTANDLQNVRGLQSQGALAAQGLRSQGALAAQGLRSQGALASQQLESQGELAALNANSGIYQSGLGLNAANDRAAMQANAGLLSDAMNLDAADLNQRRSIGSNEAQFAETALRGAGALNLQGGQALGQLAQAGTADERQRIADMLAAGQAGDARNQQDLDFIYGEFGRELAYPGQQIDLRNAAISPATGSIVTTTQPRYEQNPLVSAIGAGVGAYGLTQNPYLALLAGGAGLLSS